jgi:hypothetical protein
MRTIATTLVLSSLLFGAPVMAGGGHDHGHSHAQAPVNKEAAEKSAAMAVASLIAGGQIDQSWSSVTVNSSKKKDFNGRTEWVVTFVNEKVTDPSKQKLYVFMTLSGEYVAANYTGN